MVLYSFNFIIDHILVLCRLSTRVLKVRLLTLLIVIVIKLTVVLGKMGAYKYIGELYKKKQSDVLRFLLRVRYVVQPCRWWAPYLPSVTDVGSIANSM